MKQNQEDLTQYRTLGGLTLIQLLTSLAVLGIVLEVAVRYFF